MLGGTQLGRIVLQQLTLSQTGLDSQIQSAFGADPSQTGISRIASAAAAEGEAPAEPKEPSLQQKVKTAVGLVCERRNSLSGR